MIDFVKVVCKNPPNLLNHPDLDFKQLVNTKTGELSPVVEAETDNLKFKIYQKGLLIITGSLHKYYNGGFHNWNDYTYQDVCFTLTWLKNQFGLCLSDCVLQNIEFGVNIVTTYNVQDILNNLLLHKEKPFDSYHNGYYRQIQRSDYFIKVYNKGKQYNQKENIMRFEIKCVKSRVFNPMGIFSLDDLLSENWIGTIKNRLLSEWQNILVYDSTMSFKTVDDKYYKWNNATYWSSLNRMQRSREMKKYKAQVNSFSKRVHYTILESISENWLYCAKN